MRVISGILKGRRLVAPPGMAIRPTADRIKESLFNILGGSVVAKRVLDLFAGTGALGIEALSRGAACALFVDFSPAARSAIRRNIRELALDDRARVIHWDLRKNLDFLIRETAAFDLVFLDPPYQTQAVAPVLTALSACRALAPGARVIIEHSLREPVAQPADSLVLVDQRRFGKTLVSFMDVML